MKKKLINGNQPKKITADELLKGLIPDGRYDHLRIIISKEKKENPQFGQKYLMVTPSDFLIVKLSDLYYKDNHVHLQLQDSVSGTIYWHLINIDSQEITLLLLSLNDLKTMLIDNNDTGITTITGINNNTGITTITGINNNTGITTTTGINNNTRITTNTGINNIDLLDFDYNVPQI